MTPTTIPLPATDRSQPGTAHCPHCGKRIGMETRCAHVDVLLTPSENGGQWGLVVWDVPFEVPVLKMRDNTEKPEGNLGVTDRVLKVLAAGDATEREIRERAEIDSQGAAAAAIQRLRDRGDVVKVAVRRVEHQGRVFVNVYGLTAAGRAGVSAVAG